MNPSIPTFLASIAPAGGSSVKEHAMVVIAFLMAASAIIKGGKSWIARLDADRLAGDPMFDPREAKRRKDTVVTGITFTVILILGLFATAEAVLYLYGRPSLAFLAMVWAMAAHAAGQFMGFLFAVPKSAGDGEAGDSRVAEGGQAADGEAARKSVAVRRASRTNTSLEQISDWLTKIIVGVSLVESKELMVQFKKAVLWFASGLSDGPDATSKALAAAVLVLFPVIGFLGTYLITRTYLAEVLNDADAAVNQWDAFARANVRPETSDEARGALRAAEGEKMRVDQQKIASEPTKGIQFSPTALKLAEKFKDVSFETLRTWKEFAAWGLSQLAEKKPQEALRGYERAMELKQNDPSLLFEYVVALDQAGTEDVKSRAIDALRKAAEAVSKAADSKLTPEECKLRADIYNSLTFRLLYGGTREARLDAVKYADEFLGFAGADMQGAVLVNRACALGQLASSVTDRNSEEFKKLRDQALKDAEAAIKLDTGWRARLRFLLDPNHPDKKQYPEKFKGENDLEVFATDAEFAATVGSRLPDAA